MIERKVFVCKLDLLIGDILRGTLRQTLKELYSIFIYFNPCFGLKSEIYIDNKKKHLLKEFT